MYLVAEVGPCEGDIDYAKACAEAIKEAAPTYGTMKGQWYTSETITRPGANRYDSTPGGPDTQGELFETQLNWDEWYEVVEYCRSIGLPFFPTVFSFEAVEKAREMGLETMKIASGDITHLPLIQYASSAASHLVISTGGATSHEVVDSVQALNDQANATYLACHLAYPSTWKQANLARINAVRGLIMRASGGQANRFAVGYSDHTPQFRFLDMLMAMGASMWEKHFTVARYGHEHGDHSFAIDENDLRIMEHTIGEVDPFFGEQWAELKPTDAEYPAIQGARRSLIWAVNAQAGDELTPDHFDYLRPGDGLSPAHVFSLLGRILVKDVQAGDEVELDEIVGA